MSLPLNNKQLTRLAWAAELRALSHIQMHCFSHEPGRACFAQVLERMLIRQGVLAREDEIGLHEIAMRYAGLTSEQAWTGISMNDGTLWGGSGLPKGPVRRHSFVELADWLEQLPAAGAQNGA